MCYPHSVCDDLVSGQSRHLTADQVDHFREAFNLFDTDGGGSIDIEELGSCLRSLGQNLSEKELADMITEFDKVLLLINGSLCVKAMQDNTGSIGFEGFLEMLASHTGDMELDKELVAGLRGMG